MAKNTQYHISFIIAMLKCSTNRNWNPKQILFEKGKTLIYLHYYLIWSVFVFACKSSNSKHNAVDTTSSFSNV